MSVNKWIEKNIKSLDGKRIVITGANSGIGFEAAKICAFKGATVILACRSFERASKAVQLIKNDYPNAKLSIMIYDQSSLKSIDEFVNNLINEYEYIDALIANAGIYHPSMNQKTKDNLPLTLGVNYFGCYYLVNKLLPYLEQNENSRIILVSSLTYRFAKYKNLSFLEEDDKNVSKNYGLSKLAIAKLFIHLINNSKVKVLMMHPGISSTNIFSSSNNNFPRWFQKLAHIFLPLFTHSPHKACLGMVKLASDENIENGTYLGPRGPFGISGYPIKKRIPKRIYKDVSLFIDETNKILEKVKKENE